MKALMETQVQGYSRRQGKVRDIYNLGDDRIVIITTDRISAFDVVIENGIPGKGRVLTEVTKFWLKTLLPSVLPNHLISTDLKDLPKEFQREEFEGRTMLCRKAEPLPVEFVVRGFITGSAWKEYQKTGEVFGAKPEEKLKECEQLPNAVFTPTTKADSGHDENITFTDVCNKIGQVDAVKLRNRSLRMYVSACKLARSRGLIIADTKFEFGIIDNETCLIDEVLTPDSSRFWPAGQYEPGKGQPSFDKQFVRDYLQGLCDEGKWDKTLPGPILPPEVVEETTTKYLQLYEMLIGKELKI